MEYKKLDGRNQTLYTEMLVQSQIFHVLNLLKKYVLGFSSL